MKRISPALLLFIGVACVLWTSFDNSMSINNNNSIDNNTRGRRKLSYVRQSKYIWQPKRHRESPPGEHILNELHSKPLQICSRAATTSHSYDLEMYTKYANICQEHMNKPKSETSVLLLDGLAGFGRTGNNFIEFLHALQYARDQPENTNMIVGIIFGTFFQQRIMEYSFAIPNDDIVLWKEMFESAFCVKIFDDRKELEEYKFVDQRVGRRTGIRDLFLYSPLRYEHKSGSISKTGIKLQSEYVEYQTHLLRTFWRSHHTGVDQEGIRMTSVHHEQVKDMCSVVNRMFPQDRKKNQEIKYTVIHSRSLEGEPGKRLLARVAAASGCDSRAALDMSPDYIKSILKETDMLSHPVLFITDHQRPEILQKLRDDPDIGPNIRLIPDEVSWVGGDITAAVMSSVFIGNPASTLSGFIAKSRVALGYTDNYLFRRLKENKSGSGRVMEWTDVRTPVEIFDRRVMGAEA